MAFRLVIGARNFQTGQTVSVYADLLKSSALHTFAPSDKITSAFIYDGCCAPVHRLPKEAKPCVRTISFAELSLFSMH